MIDVKRKFRDLMTDYINSKTELDLNRELTSLKRYTEGNLNKISDFVSIDERIYLLSEKLTENVFAAALCKAVLAYAENNIRLYYNQSYESVSDGVSEGEVLLEMFSDEDENLVLSSIEIKNPINSIHTVSDFLVFSEINRLFLYEPYIFLETLLGRIYTGDVLLKYTDNLKPTMKINLTVNSESTDKQGCVLKAKYRDGSLIIERHSDIKEERDCVLNLNAYETCFDWFNVIY
ncbi:MAG: hypothetical protein LUD81_00570 [Clostridiales bacterium]|nr:hypothetical protein [Clostridiales bacterium]